MKVYVRIARCSTAVRACRSMHTCTVSSSCVLHVFSCFCAKTPVGFCGDEHLSCRASVWFRRGDRSPHHRCTSPPFTSVSTPPRPWSPPPGCPLKKKNALTQPPHHMPLSGEISPWNTTLNIRHLKSDEVSCGYSGVVFAWMVVLSLKPDAVRDRKRGVGGSRRLRL